MAAALQRSSSGQQLPPCGVGGAQRAAGAPHRPRLTLALARQRSLRGTDGVNGAMAECSTCRPFSGAARTSAPDPPRRAAPGPTPLAAHGHLQLQLHLGMRLPKPAMTSGMNAAANPSVHASRTRRAPWADRSPCNCSTSSSACASCTGVGQQAVLDLGQTMPAPGARTASTRLSSSLPSWRLTAEATCGRCAAWLTEPVRARPPESEAQGPG